MATVYRIAMNCMINRISMICKIRYLWHSPYKPALGLIWFIKHHDRPLEKKKHHHSVPELSSMPCQDSNRRRQTYSASQCWACSFWGPIPFAFHSQMAKVVVDWNSIQCRIKKPWVEKIKSHQCSGVSPFLENISCCTCMVGSGYMYRKGDISYCTGMADSA